MKVRISEIGLNGLIINDTISLDALNKRLNEGHKSDMVFTSAPRVTLIAHTTPQGVETHGKVTARYNQACSLCLKDIDKQIEVSGDFIFQKRPFSKVDVEPEAVEEYFDDVGITYFSGDHIELEDLIQESLILQLSPYWRPAHACDGSCTVCGLKACDVLKGKVQETATEEVPVNNFGNLLKIAGVK